MKQTPLPRLKNGVGGKITIAGGERRQEPDLIAAARENARVLASAIEADGEAPSNPIVERTAEKLHKAKPAPITGLVSVEGAGLIKAEVAPASSTGWSLPSTALSLRRMLWGSSSVVATRQPRMSAKERRSASR